MAAEQGKLLTKLEEEVRNLLFLYRKIKEERDELTLELETKKGELSDAQSIAQEWEKKYQNLQLVKIISVSEQEAKNTQHRLSKLEREIDKCIALLNE